ncbi:MAG: hypothetical protein F6K00_13965 [Leptolyngbya sp. SIOISBB]|nr:hypothetical protein [Leptolyngbya sp. SIOISBB]
MTIEPQPQGQLFRNLGVAIAFGVSTLMMSTPTLAEVPEQTRIDDLLGNSSELLIRRSGRRESVQIGTVLQRVRDALLTVPPNNARAMLRFLSASGEDLNFYVQTNPHPEASIYYFPCQVQGGDYLIGWGLASNADRGCETGLQVTRGGSTGAIVPSEPMALATKELAQVPVRQIFYCVAADSSGSHGLATSTTSDPCGEAIAQCAASGGDCNITSTGFWWSSEPELQASLICEDGTVQTVAGSGDTLEGDLTTLVAAAQAANCSAQVYRSDDVVIVPATDAAVQAEGSDEILVQTRSTDAGLQVDVLKGAVNVLAAGEDDPAMLQQGERYSHNNASGQVTTFDREAALTSVDMEVLCAFASNSADRLRVDACQEGLGIDTSAGIPVAFCNREQASGGQEGDRRFVQMSASQGEIKLDYEMFDVPDRLQIFQDGVQILDTGFLSGRDSLTLPLTGTSGRLEVVVTGNAAIATTEWNYLLTCP